MADQGVSAEKFRFVCSDYGATVLIAYASSRREIFALSDLTLTSSNSGETLLKIPAPNLIFIPVGPSTDYLNRVITTYSVQIPTGKNQDIFSVIAQSEGSQQTSWSLLLPSGVSYELDTAIFRMFKTYFVDLRRRFLRAVTSFIQIQHVKDLFCCSI